MHFYPSLNRFTISNQEKLEHPAHKAKQACIYIEQKFYHFESIWSYLGKTLVLTKSLLNASIRSCNRLALGCQNLDERVFRLINRLKLFSIIGIPYSIIGVQSAAQKIIKSYQQKENFFLPSLSFVVLVSDVIDSIATFMNALRVLTSKAPLESLAALGMPLALTMNGLGSLSRIVQIAKTYMFFKNLHSQVISKSHGDNLEFSNEIVTALKTFIKKKLDVDSEEIWLIAVLSTITNTVCGTHFGEKKKENLLKLREKKKASFLAEAPLEVFEEFEKLMKLINKKMLTKQQTQELIFSLKKTIALLKKKMTIDGVNLLSNLLSLVGLCLFLVQIHPALPFILLASSFFLKLLCLGYQDFVTFGGYL